MNCIKFLFFILLSFSALADGKKYEVPELPDVLSSFGKAKHKYLGNKFSLISWNIYKGAKDNFRSDYQQISADADIVIIQEFLTNTDLLQMLTENIDFQAAFAASFNYSYEGVSTGVLNTSNTLPLSTAFIRTTNREPILKTPKMSLITIYEFSNCDKKLMVVNTHAINFVTNGKFYHDISKIADSIKDHSGPLIWAGDFNTWSKRRLSYLEMIARKIGLTFAALKDSYAIKKFMGNPLDHILYKDLELTDGEVLKDIESSDHIPLKADFNYAC